MHWALICLWQAACSWKISVLTFFPYQSLKVNVKLLIRKKHKEQVKRLLTERSVLHPQLRSPLSWSTHTLVSKSHAQKKGYRKQPLHLCLCYQSRLGLVFAANEDIPVAYQTILTESPNLGFVPQKTKHQERVYQTFLRQQPHAMHAETQGPRQRHRGFGSWLPRERKSFWSPPRTSQNGRRGCISHPSQGCSQIGHFCLTKPFKREHGRGLMQFISSASTNWKNTLIF